MRMPTNFTLAAFLVMYRKGSITYLGNYLGKCIRNLLNLHVYHPWGTCNEIWHLCTSMITLQTIQ